MNKKDIIRKLSVDLDNANHLIKNDLVSADSKVRLESVADYIESLLERIQQDGKV
jgi:hypothetical protein